MNNLLKVFIKQKKLKHIKETYDLMRSKGEFFLNIFNINNTLHSAI